MRLPRIDSLWVTLGRVVLAGGILSVAWPHVAPGIQWLLWTGADLSWPHCLPNGAIRVDRVEEGWRVHTGWPLLGQASQFVFFITNGAIEHANRALLWMLGLLIAVARWRPWRWAASLGLTLLLAFAALTLNALVVSFVAQGGVASALQPQVPPPPMLLDLPKPWGGWLPLCAFLLLAIGVLCHGIFPVIVWLMLFPQSASDLWERLRDRPLQLHS